MNALLRRLRPRPATPDPKLPWAWMDEDGEDVYAMGHIEPHRMVLAAVVEQLLCTDAECAIELLFDTSLMLAQVHSTTSREHVARLIERVEHTWRREDPGNEEVWARVHGLPRRRLRRHPDALLVMGDFWVRFKGGKWHSASAAWLRPGTEIKVECKRSWSYRRSDLAEVADVLPKGAEPCCNPACIRAYHAARRKGQG